MSVFGISFPQNYVFLKQRDQVEDHYATSYLGTLRGYPLISSFSETNLSNKLDANQIQYFKKYSKIWETEGGETRTTCVPITANCSSNSVRHSF